LEFFRDLPSGVKHSDPISDESIRQTPAHFFFFTYALPKGHDFLVNGQSLYELLSAHSFDLVGRFWQGDRAWNEESANIFLTKQSADLENGHTMLYVCPECGDIGCGAITVTIIKSDNSYSWTEFGYENNYAPQMMDSDSYAMLDRSGSSLMNIARFWKRLRMPNTFLGRGDDCPPFPLSQPTSTYGWLRYLAALAELLRLPRCYRRFETAMSINEDLAVGLVGNTNP
jgi:hypothetical protein